MILSPVLARAAWLVLVLGSTPAAAPHELDCRVDLATVRDIGWCSHAASDGDATELASRQLERHLRRWPLGGHGTRDFHVRVAAPGRVTVVTPELSGAERGLLVRRIRFPGRVELGILAEESDFRAAGTDAAAERQRLDAWRAANPAAPLVLFDLVPRNADGPLPNMTWVSRAPAPGQDPDVVPVLRLDSPWDFSGTDLARVSPAQDSLGFPAVAFELERDSAFGDFTEAHVNRSLAIVLDGVVVSAPNIEDRLSGASIIRGRFDAARVRELVDRLGAPDCGSVFRVVGPAEPQDETER